MSNFIFYILMLMSACITAFSQIILKKSADRKYKSVFFEYLNPYVLFSYACYIGVQFKRISPARMRVFIQNTPFLLTLFAASFENIPVKENNSILR